MKLSLLLFTLFISGCDYSTNINKSKEYINKQDAIAFASCKQSGKTIEDCFIIQEDISKSGIFDGWKEMEQYMRENNLKEQSSSLI
jgi:ATP-dependent phosphoenolpyruvate carboxykinase